MYAYVGYGAVTQSKSVISMGQSLIPISSDLICFSAPICLFTTRYILDKTENGSRVVVGGGGQIPRSTGVEPYWSPFRPQTGPDTEMEPSCYNEVRVAGSIESSTYTRMPAIPSTSPPRTEVQAV